MRGSETFKGFSIQARRTEGNRDEPIGFFRLANAGGSQFVCDGTLGVYCLLSIDYSIEFSY